MIKMNLTYPGEYRIDVFSGGNLTLIGSTITALNRSNRYYIRVHPDRPYREYESATYTTEDLKRVLYIVSRPSVYGIRITCEPTTAPPAPFKIYTCFYIRRVA